MSRARPCTASVVAILAVLVGASCSSSKDTTTSTASSNPSKLPAYAATLQPQIVQLLKDNAIPGATVLIRSRDQGDWTATFGTTELGKETPPTVDDFWRIASNTKMYTSTVILQLVQEGKLKLDDPISKFRPDVPNGDNITIAQLSEMRSGLFPYTSDLGVNETQDNDPKKVWTPEECLAIAFAHPPDFAPGTQFEYSNTNTVLLGLVVEKLTGMSLADAYKKRIFEPLGLKHTSMPAATDASIPDPHPQGYSFGTNVSTIETFALPPDQQAAAVAGTLKPTNHTNDNPSYAFGAGNLISTVDDMATFIKAMVGGGLMDEQMQKIRMDSIQPINPANPAAGYGLGILRFPGKIYGHDGQMPGFMTFMGYDPVADNTIIVATNLATVPSGQGSALVLVKAILPVLYGSGAIPGDSGAAPSTTTG
ncbi:MAG TPA: serine hydrolase domain-containing protein [Acidimicrobiales bacterium]|nr:serine hydrolase domain-containing protein [Acidimicrobiales bacterium]